MFAVVIKLATLTFLLGFWIGWFAKGIWSGQTFQNDQTNTLATSQDLLTKKEVDKIVEAIEKVANHD